jgi:hypothetical protein
MLSGQAGVETRVQQNSRAGARWPWALLLLLLALCLARGLWLTRGLDGPAYFDGYRDTGSIQAILDGNLFGDASLPGAWRWYPPLVQLIAAAGAWVAGGRAMAFWIGAAPWLNLLLPASFFLAARRLLNAEAAALGTAVLVLFNAALIPAADTATYAPWAFTPTLAMPLFLLGVALTHARVASARLGDAALIGGVAGLAFLAHPVPGIMLAAVAAAAAVAAQELRWRLLGWLIVMGGATLALSLIFLLPLMIAYRLQLVGTASAYVESLFTLWPIPRRLIATLLPGLLALPLLALPRAVVGLGHETRAILLAWIGLPALFLLRHYLCGGPVGPAACTVLLLPVHHWHIYLQAGLACLIGHAAWLAARRWPGRPSIIAGVALGLMGCLLFLRRPDDAAIRQRALEGLGDVELYGWVLDHTRPRDLFVTELPRPVRDPAALAVLAAARRQVAPPEPYANPYVPWAPHDRRRAAYLAAAAKRDLGPLCQLVREAGPGADSYIVLANPTPTPAHGLVKVFGCRSNAVFRVRPERCRPG